MTISNPRVLNFQRTIRADDWMFLKDNPDLKTRIIEQEAMRYIANALVKEHLATVVVTDPTEDSIIDPTFAAIRCTIVVGMRDEAAHFARQLAEAEERGFAAALKGVRDGLDAAIPQMGPTSYEHAAASRLIARVEHERNHRPAADWRPMSSRDRPSSGIQFLFANGDVSTSPRRVVPIPMPLDLTAEDAGTSSAVPSCEELFAVAWRHQGHHPVREAAA